LPLPQFLKSGNMTVGLSTSGPADAGIAALPDGRKERNLFPRASQHASLPGNEKTGSWLGKAFGITALPKQHRNKAQQE